MRGSIYGIVAIGLGVAMTPAILDVDVSGDATGQTALDLITTINPVLGLVLFVAAMGLLINFFTDSGF